MTIRVIDDIEQMTYEVWRPALWKSGQRVSWFEDFNHRGHIVDEDIPSVRKKSLEAWWENEFRKRSRT